MNHHDVFMECAKPGKCEVCETEGPVVVVSSRLGPISCAYCEECYDANLEPYSIIVPAIWTCGWNNMAEKYKNIIEKSLIKMGKTLDEAFDDAAYAESEFWDWVNQSMEDEEVEG